MAADRQLRILFRGERRAVLLLDLPAVLVGRGGDTQIDLAPNKAASRRHCTIRKTYYGYEVEDLETRNGTRVNGQPIQEQELKLGDVVMIGEHELILEEATPEAKSLAERFSGWDEDTTFLLSSQQIDKVRAELQLARKDRIELERDGKLHIEVLKGVLRIGSTPACQIQFAAKGFFGGGVLATVTEDDEGWTLAPVKRAAKTRVRVDGEALVEPVVLDDGDLIDIDDVSLHFFKGKRG